MVTDKGFLSLMLVVLQSLCVNGAAAAQSAPPILEEYARFYSEVDVAGWDASGPNIIEFYSYNCSYCLEAEPYIQRLKQDLPEDVKFDGYVIASGDMAWQLSQYAFTAARMAGIDEKIREPMYQWIHQDQRQLDSKQDVRTFFEEQGFLDKVELHLESDASRAMRGMIYRLAVNAGISKTPTFVVNGKYVVHWGTDQEPAKFSALLIALSKKTSLEGQLKSPEKQEPSLCKPQGGCNSTPEEAEI